MAKRVLIVGGVAGGASCAARLRRLDESAEIVIFDRGPYVSFANCGLPYHVGNIIADERKLLVVNSDLFRDRFNITVHTGHLVEAIDRVARTIRVRELATGTLRTEAYDVLVLAPGAAPIRPPLPGIDLPGIFSIRTIPDTRRVRAWLDDHQAKQALVIGGGFIGLEMAENLVHRGLHVTVVEKAPQVMPPIDAPLAVPVRERLEANNVVVRLGEAVSAITQRDGRLEVATDRGAELVSDLVILAIGVRPETALAREAGLTIGPSGGIAVDARMRTSDPHIYAVGDAVESRSVITGAVQVLPLAGPANRQGRLAADAIAGRAVRFRGVQGTAVCGVFGLTVACTGANTRQLAAAGIPVAVAHLHPGHHAGYYPGAKPIHLSVLYRPDDGRLLGAQAVGEEGVDKRIDVIAMAIQLGGTVDDLAEAELCYAPQFGAAKDPVNLVGFIAGNQRCGDVPVIRDPENPAADGALVLDVREPAETASGTVAGARCIPLSVLRERWRELPGDRPLAVMCAAGQRAYHAVRFLRQHGLDARQVPGGYTTWRYVQAAGAPDRC